MTPSRPSAGAQHLCCRIAEHVGTRRVHCNNLSFDRARRRWQLVTRDRFRSHFRDGPTSDVSRCSSDSLSCGSRRHGGTLSESIERRPRAFGETNRPSSETLHKFRHRRVERRVGETRESGHHISTLGMVRAFGIAYDAWTVRFVCCPAEAKRCKSLSNLVQDEFTRSCPTA